MTESTRTRAWIGLGGNLGDAAACLRQALRDLKTMPDTRLLRHSALYRSPPWGGIEQPPFINAVAELDTGLSPRALLEALLAIERNHGRRRDGARWGPRTLDLDLLVYGTQRVAEEGLDVPHPRLAERAFVLLPMVELQPALRIPGVGVAAELLACIDATQCVRLDET